MVRRYIFCVLLVFIAVGTVAAQTQGCEVPDGMTNEQKADHFKIKYLKPPYPDHNPRFNEVFTAVATTRIMWALGFPADYVYPAGSANCIGCTDDPFGQKLSDNKASLRDAPAVFKV